MPQTLIIAAVAAATAEDALPFGKYICGIFSV